MPTRIASDFTGGPAALAFFREEMAELLVFYERYYADGADLGDEICVAVSGGSDSLALLLLAHRWALDRGLRVVAATVDHRLRPESQDEATFVRDFCGKINLESATLIWDFGKDPPDHGKMENAAREARYGLLSEFCRRRSIRILLTGHTWNDQLETYELRRSRGSGAIGLAGVSRLRSLVHGVKLMRPVMHCTKEYLENFLRSEGVVWKNDPMNADDSLQRVFWRKKIASYGREEIFRLSDEILRRGEARREADAAAVAFLKDFCAFSSLGHAAVAVAPFLGLGKAVQMEVLRRVIWNVGGKKYATAISSDILEGIINGKINTIGRCLLKIRGDNLLAFRENRRLETISVTPPSDEGTTVREILWDNRFRIKINVPLVDCSIESSSLNGDPDDILRRLSSVTTDREVLFGLPWVRQNHKIGHVSAGLSPDGIVFVDKTNLFDVFF
ncbi:MAG: tRNA lysidine(34) synthetase TilS [Holosporaceae bacterium]|jgi:tRNA(Ile)-lysidine synthase|nr:tRNA lysidine(34) synthetase TilS [Holosporaceae bacterium]